MKNTNNQIDFSIVGSGTAGLVSALMLRKAFPKSKITVISSSNIGIIGVGEGSTEHWKMFMDICDIPLLDLLVQTRATHKNGIRFENWTKHTPDYFHSVSLADTYGHFGLYGLYNGLIAQGKTLTENISSRSMIENMVRADSPHESVNQYHFDTFKLNEYLTRLCSNRDIILIDNEVSSVNLDSETGYINSVSFVSGHQHYSNFWIDASGLRRVLISEVGDPKWISFSDYLQMDSAIAFPTESDPSGQIRPYTRARALKNGWVWEIPTQDRRGNGYVYSSKHCSDDQAINEVSELLGFEVTPARKIKFESGHISNMWIKNCVAIGLASSFVEPLEATSIGSTIQQLRCLIQNLGSYTEGSVNIQKHFNNKMNLMMENILAMIRLHYISDRSDSSMWIEQGKMPIPDYLQNLLDIWSERPPSYEDIPSNNYELFLVPHFYHVGQGQGIFKKENSSMLINRFGITSQVDYAVSYAKLNQTSHSKIDHAESLKQIQV